jgi:DNA-binding GntR family transcriptional regulator
MMPRDNAGQGEGKQSVIEAADPSTVFSTRKFADGAAQIIRQMILTNEIQAGERLNEISLAQRLGISRSPLREAIQSLAGEGLVRFVPGRGAFVVELGLETVRHLVQIRIVLECLGARLAADSASEKQLHDLEALLETTEGSMDDQAPYPSDLDFHYSLLKASASPPLLEMTGTLSTQLRLARLRSAQQPRRARQALNEHRLILDALKRHDPDTAAKAMEQHLNSALINVTRLFDS